MNLKYNNFGEEWLSGLPIGNGRLAAMVWGGNNKDIISVNHESVWTGDFRGRKNEDMSRFLPEVRDFLKKGEYFKATALSALAFGGNGGISPLQRRTDSYQPIGDLVVEYSKKADVKRTLNMENGYVTSVKSDVKLVSFCDVINNILVNKWTFDNSNDISLSLIRDDDDRVEKTVTLTDSDIAVDCKSYHGVSFKAIAKYKTDGKITCTGEKVSITSATYLTVFLNVGTSVKGIETELANFIDIKKDIDTILSEHSKKFADAMKCADMDISDEETKNLEKLTINERIQLVKKNESQDVNLIAKYAQFGAYLMVAGCICGELPLNLQGKWNERIYPKWNSDYHLNVNLQMNYWFAEKLGMTDYIDTMLDYLMGILPKAKESAKLLYNCRGALYPLNSDVWGNCSAEAYNYAVWVGGGGWLAQHFWQRYEYSGDKDYLKNVCYPFLKEVATFYQDYIEFDENNIAQIMPSQSPENKFVGTGYFPVSICTSAAMDVQIIFEAMTNAVKAAKLLNVDKESILAWENIRDNLPEFKIGSDGRLLEWDSEDKIEVEEGHRHFSHLYGAYPSEIFTKYNRQPQFWAAKKSLEYRLSHDSGHTGWSRAWACCLFARFGESEKMHDNLISFVSHMSSPTMLDLHPDYYPIEKSDKGKQSNSPKLFSDPEENPPMIFQIDGNMGATAALLEAVVQTYDGVHYLLPAVSKRWKKGSFSYVRTVGGNVFSIKWEQDKITHLEVTLGYTKRVSIGDINSKIFDNINKDKFNITDNVATYSGEEGERVVFTAL